MGFAGGFVVVGDFGGFDAEMDDVGVCGGEGEVCVSMLALDLLSPRTDSVLGVSLPFNAALSSIMRPMMISRILLGLAGLGSHSDLQSFRMSSFNW